MHGSIYLDFSMACVVSVVPICFVLILQRMIMVMMMTMMMMTVCHRQCIHLFSNEMWCCCGDVLFGIVCCVFQRVVWVVLFGPRPHRYEKWQFDPHCALC